jgi:hypothetical protein
MKTTVKLLFLPIMVFVVSSQSLVAQKQNDLPGYWHLHAPDAPNGFQTFILKITKDSVFATPVGESYSYKSDFMKFENDTLKFEMNEILSTLTFESKTKMTGYSVWPDGKTKITFTRIMSNDSIYTKQK